MSRYFLFSIIKIIQLYPFFFFLQRCVPRGTLYEINNMEIWLLIIGSFIGAFGLIAALTTCCLFTKYYIHLIIQSLNRRQFVCCALRYESRMRKLIPGIKVIDRSAMLPRGAPPPPNMVNYPPMSVYNNHPDSRLYEWQEHSTLPLDRSSR